MAVSFSKIHLNRSTILYCLMILLNLLSHPLQNLFEFSNTYMISYVCWVILLIYSVFSNIKATYKELLICLVLMISLLIGYSMGLSKGYLKTVDILNVCVFILAFFLTKTVNINKRLDTRQLEAISNIIYLVSLLALAYMFVKQGGLIPSSLQGSPYAAWGIVSFFHNRNVFAGFCFFSVIVSMYLYLQRKRIIYLISIAAFIFAIVCTDSRASLVGVLFFLGMYFYLKTKRRLLLVLVCLVSAVVLVFQFNLLGYVFENFSHISPTGEESAMGRISMWVAGFKELTENFGILFGYGVGSSERFLIYNGFRVGSFHNVYVESLFMGGIVMLACVIYSLVGSIKLILKSKNDNYRKIWLAGILAFIVYCLFESGSAPFMSNYFSVTVTILFIVVPKLIYKTECEEQIIDKEGC